MKKSLLLILLTTNFALAGPTTTVDYSDFETYAKVSKQCVNWVKNEEFNQIEKFLKNNDNETSKDPSGRAIVTQCLTSTLKVEQLLTKWQKQYPKSIYPGIIRQLDLYDKFFEIRGSGFINTIPPEQFTKALNLLEEGAKDLDNIKKLGVSPFFYQVRIEIAFLQQDRNIFFNYLAEAIKKYPNYIPIYSQAASQMRPEWGFSYQDLDNFALLAMNSSSLKEEAYTTVYKSAVKPCCSNKLINAGYFNQELYRKGMYSILKKYPTQYNYNSYAQYSCLLGDYDSTKILIEEKMTTYVKLVWYPKEYQYCTELLAAIDKAKKDKLLDK